MSPSPPTGDSEDRVSSAAEERRRARELRTAAAVDTTLDSLLGSLAARRGRVTLETAAGSSGAATLLDASAAGIVARRDDDTLWLVARDGLEAITLETFVTADAASRPNGSGRDEPMGFGDLVRRWVRAGTTVQCRSLQRTWTGVVEACGRDLLILGREGQRERTYLTVDSLVELLSADSSS